MLLLPLALACTLGSTDKPVDDVPADDTAADTGGPAALAPGDVADMATTDAGVSIDLAEAGTYIVVLVSTDKAQDTLYGYGEHAGDAARLDPPDLAPLPIPPAPAKRANAVAVGDHRDFTVYDGAAWQTVDAVATTVTDTMVVWEDQTTPNAIGALDQATVDGVVDAFSTIVLPRERQVFGDESDVDGDGKIGVLLSYTVNTYGAVAYVSWCDIGIGADCAGSSNDGEIIYMGIPDPTSEYGSVAAITETFAHEFNHLIYSWHKYGLNDATSASENPYVTEGTSALAQDLTGYNNGNQYVWGTALDGTSIYHDADASIQGVSYNDILRGHGGYDASRDGVLRGGSYLLLRYLFEQAGGFTVEDDGTLDDAGGIAWIHSFFDAPETGVDAVETTTGRAVEDIAMDWYTALVVTGRVDNSNPAWNYQDRVTDPLTGYEFGIDPFDTIHGWWTLTGPLVQEWDSADGQLRAGGVEYLQVTTTGPQTLALDVDADAKARARVLRVE